MPKSTLLPVVLLILLPGCFPIELDVNKSGQLLVPRQEGFFVFEPASGKVKRVGDAKDKKPVFARFAPNDKEFLAVSEVELKEFDPMQGIGRWFSFELLPLAGGKGREVFRGSNCAYARFSPDGSRLAIGRLGEKKYGDVVKQEPELHIVSVKDGKSKRLPQVLGVFFRWFADSQRLLVFELKKKIEDDKGFTQAYVGNLSILDVTTATSTPLVSLAITTDFFVDLSPNNKKALFTASQANKVAVEVKKGQKDKMKLFVLDIDARTVHPTGRQADYAIFSPSGKQVLLGTPPKDGFGDTFTLDIFNDALTKRKTIAETIPRPSTISFNGEGTLYPGWIDEKTLFYFSERAVYGLSGKSLSLMTVGIEGKGRQCVQPLIDLEAIKHDP